MTEFANSAFTTAWQYALAHGKSCSQLVRLCWSFKTRVFGPLVHHGYCHQWKTPSKNIKHTSITVQSCGNLYTWAGISLANVVNEKNINLWYGGSGMVYIMIEVVSLLHRYTQLQIVFFYFITRKKCSPNDILIDQKDRIPDMGVQKPER